MSEVNSRTDAMRAALWMVGAMLSFTAMAIAGRELSAHMSTFQILFFRSVIGLIIVSVLVWRSGLAQLKSQQPGLQLLRNVIHYAGQYGWFLGIALLPLADVFAIEFTTPIWTLLLAVPILGERLTRTRLWVVAIGFVGVLVILRPGSEVIDLGAIAVLAAALSYAMTHVLTKKLSRTDTTLSILFYMTLIQLPLGLIPSLTDWYWPTLADWPWIVLVGVTALSAHYCLTAAFRLADASFVIPLDFLRLPLAAVFGLLVYGEALDPFVIAGAAIIMAGVYLNIRKG